ncbi:MAG: Ig-like domain-containing protein [Gammaproteobacteria bacterium]
MWVGTKAGLHRYDAFGRPLEGVRPASSHIRALAYERDRDALWVADKKQGLRRYALANDALEREVALPIKAKDVDFLVPDGQGGLWIGEDHTLIKLDREGEIQFHLKLFAGPGNDKLVALLADAVDGSAWVASKERVAKLSAEGDLQQSFTPGSGNKKPKIRALALYLDTAAPILSITAPAKDAFLNINQPQLAFSYSDAGIGVDANTLALTLNEQPLAVRCDYSEAQATCTASDALSEGAPTLVATIADFHGQVSLPARVSFTVDTVAPGAASPSHITLGDPVDGKLTITGRAGAVEPGAWVTITNTRTGESVTVKAGADGSFSVALFGQSGDTFQIRVTDLAGNTSEWRPLAIGNGAKIPPDPATIAPSLSSTGITPMKEAVAFLYSGTDPIQTGVEEGAIEPRRVAVIRGKVLDRENQPLSGVTLTIKDHPEFGQTVSREDGMFDLAVNGGGQLTLDYQRPGFLPVQRTVQTPWQDFVLADDVVMIPLDGQVTRVDLSANSVIQVAQSTLATDADGSRQATVLFPQRTEATMTLGDGTKQALTTLNVRATEYTVGAHGPKAMPGPLPPTSGYTYAVELSVDEAIAAGATRVDFSQPLPVFVDNFLDFPVGGIVPVGWYDREKSAWIPSDNGRIVKILGKDGDGLALLDVDGSGNAANATQLVELGISAPERAQLAALYPAGKSLWRVAVTHFTPWDCNWPYGPPEDAEPPPPEEPESEDEDQPDPEDSDECEGCSIEAQSQTLGEEIAITGTPFKLHYRSDRVPGARALTRSRSR